MRLIDTSVLIDVLRGFPPAADFLLGLDEVPLASGLTRTEVLRGVRSPERSRTETLLRSLRWVAADEPVSRRGGELARRYRRSHPGLGVVDFLIARPALPDVRRTRTAIHDLVGAANGARVFAMSSRK